MAMRLDAIDAKLEILVKPVLDGKRSANAERQARFRERHRNADVTPEVTPTRAKRNGGITRNVTYLITFNWETFTFHGITPADMKRWQEAHPALAIPDEIDRAAIWLKANPKNRKSNYERFLANWFTRNQDRAGRQA